MSRARPLLRILKILLLTLLALIFSLSLAITLFFSQPRLHLWLFTQLDGWTDGLIRVERSEGHIFRSITLHNIAIRHPDAEIDIPQLDWGLDLFHLWYGRLSLDHTHLPEIEIRLLPHTEKPSSPPNPEPFAALLRIPLYLGLDELRIGQLRLQQDGQTYQIDNIDSALAWQLRRLKLHHLKLDYQGHQLNASGHLGIKDSTRHNGSLRLTLSSTTLPPVALRASWQGSVQQIALELDLTEPLQLRSQHQLELPPAHPLKVHSHWQALRYEAAPGQLWQSTGGEMQWQLDAQQLQGQGDFGWQLNALPRTQQGFQLRFDRHDLLDIQLHSVFADAGEARFSGQVSLADERLQGELTSQLALAAFGLPADTHYQGQVQLELSDFSQPQLQLQLQDLQLQQGEHQALLNGPLHAQLDAPLGSAGRVHTPQALKIDYAGYQASLQFDSRIHRDESTASPVFVLQQLLLETQGNRLQLSGRLAETLQLQLNARLDRLDQLLPDLAGALQLEGQISGNTNAPDGRFQLHGERLRWKDARLQSIDLQTTLPLLAPWQASLELALNALHSKDTVLLDSLHLTRRREGDAMRSDLQLQRPQLALQARLQDRIPNPGQAEVQLQALQVKQAHSGNWSLQQPATIQWTAPWQLQGDPLCLYNEHQAGACLQAEAGRLSWQLSGLPVFDWLAEQLPEGLRLAGIIEGEGALEYGDAPLADWQLQQTLRSPHIAIETQQFGYRLPISIYDGQLELQANTGHAQLHKRARLNETGVFDLRLSLDNREGDWRNALLDGQLQAQLNEAELPEDLLSLLVLHQQQLSLHSQISGTPVAPQHDTSGELSLLFDLPLLGLNQQALTLHSSLDSQAISAQATLRQPQGRELQLETSLQGLQQAQPEARLTLKSDDLQWINSPFASIRAATDLQIRVQHGQLHVGGDTRLHHSRIDLQGIPLQSRTRISGDEILLDADGQPITPDQRPLPLHLDTTIHFGEQVEILVRDVNAMLGGQLNLRQQPGGDLRGFGQVTLDKGEIRLDPRNAIRIDRSSFSFNGVLGNPTLDVQLFRQVEEIQARLNITGTATAPQFVFYSTPSLSQGNIINIMIFGRAVDVNSEPNYESQLLSAFYKLGLHGNTPALSQLTSGLGIHDVYFDIQDEQSSNLILGRALTDRLYIRYAMGLSGQQSNAIQLFYRLGRSWMLESLSGDDQQSLDLIWTKEK